MGNSAAGQSRRGPQAGDTYGGSYTNVSAPTPSRRHAAGAPTTANGLRLRALGLRRLVAPGLVLMTMWQLVAAGRVVAVVGSTGAGKSTLALVAAGTLVPTIESARRGGVPLTDVDPLFLRKSITMVSQEVHSFATIVAENVRATRPEAGREEVRAALRTVGADWVDDLPEGIHTVIGEGGHPLDPMQS